MTTEPARAGHDWLVLREPADAAARSVELVDMLRPHLPAGPLEIHDLGCGTGSMARWLAGLLDGPQRWVLHDRDQELLEHAAANPPGEAADGSPVSVETRRDDITRLEHHELAGAALVTASALLDMFTEAELRRFVARCAAAGCPVLITLSVIGRVDLAPEDPLDRRVMAAFNAHQRRRTRAGRLLGPDAVALAVDAFGRRGLDVTVRPSPWRLGAAQHALTTDWFTGWLAAADEQRPELATASYAERRLAEATAGTLSVTVGHEDLLAVPNPSPRATGRRPFSRP
jgi:hypothetical protein